MLIISSSISTLSACSGSGNPTNSNVVPPTPQTTNAITIDNSGIIPVFDGAATSSFVYVRNNGNTTISGISYSAKINVNTTSSTSLISNLKQILKLSSASATQLINGDQCTTLKPGQECPLAFTIPSVSKSQAQGSLLVTASYNSENTNKSFNSILNFNQVDKSKSGVFFGSGLGSDSVILSGFGNKEAHAMLYIYGSGQDKIYKINKLLSDNPGVTIGANYVGTQIPSSYVQAIPLVAKTISSLNTKNKSQLASYKATLLLNSEDQNQSAYSDSASAGVAPIPSSAILTVSQIPLIDTATTNTGSIYLVNSGSEVATITAPIFDPSSVTRANSSTCGATLAIGASCQLDFTLSQQGTGSGTMTMNYSSPNLQTASISAAFSYYNSKDSAFVKFNASNPFLLNATIASDNTITVSNNSGYDLTGITGYAATLSGNASVSADTVNCYDKNGNSSANNLPINGYCTFKVSVADAQTEIGAIKYGINATFNKNGVSNLFDQYYLFNYQSATYQAILQLSFNPTISTIGDNKSSTSQTITINNVGQAPATISNRNLGNNPSYFTETTSDCSNTLNQNSSCTATLKLGPIASSSQSSGNAIYSISYSGGQAQDVTTQNTINYQVLPNTQDITSTFATNGSTSGGGSSSGDPIVFSGATSGSSQTVTMTYTNSVNGNPITITGVSNNNSPISWAIDYTNSTCYSGTALPSPTIQPGDACTIIFKNLLANYVDAVPNISAVYQENLTLPTITFKDMNTQDIFQMTPTTPAGDTTIYAQHSLAVVSNSLTKVSGNRLKITNTLSNANNYTPVTVKGTIFDYFISGSAQTADACTTASDSGLVNQNCIYGTATASVTYTMDTDSFLNATLQAVFDSVDKSQVVAMTPKVTTTITLVPTPAPVTDLVYSAYKDVGINANWNNLQISTKVKDNTASFPSPLVTVLPSSSMNTISWAFATGECGQENWAGMDTTQFATQNITDFNNAGLKYIVSTGGASGAFTCSTQAGMDTFLNRYISKGFVGLDFDIEVGPSGADLQNLINMIAYAQQKYPALRISFTLATLASANPSGTSLSSLGDSVITKAKSAGINFYVNLMVMDYGNSSAVCVMDTTGTNCDMNLSAQQAAKNLSKYYSIPLSNIELTPMIGVNDTTTNIMSLTNATSIASWAKANGLAGLHYWSLDRDASCVNAYATTTCSSSVNGVPMQTTALEYLNAFTSGL